MLGALNQNSPKVFHLQTSQRWCVRCFLVFYGSTGGRLLIHTRAHRHRRLPLVFLGCLLYISAPAPHPSLHLCSLHLHLRRFLPISLLLKWETTQNPARFFFSFFCGQPERIRNRGPLLITAVNQKPALTSLPWSEKSVTAALWKVQRPVWRYIVLSTLEQAKKKRKKRLKFTPCRLHFLKLGVTYL